MVVVVACVEEALFTRARTGEWIEKSRAQGLEKAACARK
jgi:hypothetical protein